MQNWEFALIWPDIPDISTSNVVMYKPNFPPLNGTCAQSKNLKIEQIKHVKMVTLRKCVMSDILYVLPEA